MATTSFDKDFVVSHNESIKAFNNSLSNPRQIKVPLRDLKIDGVKGIQLLKQKLSAWGTC